MDHGQGLALPGAERGRNRMNAERWQQVNDLFHSAAERAPEERAAFLDEGLPRRRRLVPRGEVSAHLSRADGEFHRSTGLRSRSRASG